MIVSPEFITHVIDNLHPGVIVVNKSGEIERYNKSLLDYFKIETYDDSDAKLFIESIVSNSKLGEIFQHSMREMKIINTECEIELNSREINAGKKLVKNFSVEVYPLMDGTDTAEEALAMITDITQQNENRDNPVRYKLAMDAANEGYWSWDLITNEVYFSPACMTMLGYTNDEVEQSYYGLEKLIHREDLAQAHEAIQKHLKGETETYRSEARLYCKNGDYKWALATGRIVERTADGKAKRFTGIIVDIDNIKRIEADLKKRNEKLNKIAFITSQGVRKSMANILGLTQIIDAEKFTVPENREIIDNLLKAADELNIETIKLNEAMKDLNKNLFTEGGVIKRTVNEIMIVDDDPINNLITSKYIQKAGLTSKMFENPIRAIEYLKNGSGAKHDVILLDINMPGMDGFQFLHEMEINNINIDVDNSYLINK